MRHQASPAEAADYGGIFSDLAAFRYELRKFMRFSESAARKAEITPQQHQLMLGIAGFNGSGKATVTELAEFLQERHHSVVGLIDRAVLVGLVRREIDPADRRVVVVSLTPKGWSILKKLSLEHFDEVNRMREGLLRFAAQRARYSGLSLAASQESHTENRKKKNSHV
ncbi:MAG: MarR family winged helix-turn-helix transcriptional regulator [Acidobacteriota bacterium]